MAAEIKDHLNKRLESTFDRTNDYDFVNVLTIYWEDTDQDFRGEAYKVKDFFGQVLNYNVTEFAIPTQDSQAALTTELIRFLLPQRTFRALYIIHYGGHGDRDYTSAQDRRRQSVWAAKGQGGPVLRWSDIQPKLGNARGDVLLVLDCCYGAQAARERSQGRVIPANVELLAACPMGMQTDGVGPHSFTSKFIKELKSILSEGYGWALVSLAHARLQKADRGASQTSVHISLLGRRESVRLEPLSRFNYDRELDVSKAIQANMQLSLPSDTTSELLDEISEWLSDRPPREILQASFTEVILASQSLRGYICRPEGGSSIIGYEQLSATSQMDIKKLWTFLGTQLRHAKNFIFEVKTPHLKPVLSATEPSDETGIMRRDLQDLSNIVITLQNTIDRSIQAIPALNDHEALSRAVEETMITGLQAVETLKVRLAKFSSQQDFSAVPPAQARNDELSVFQSLYLVPDSSHGEVLVEYKYHTQEEPGAPANKRNAGRMNQLVAVLQAPDSDEYRTLQCLGWSSDAELGRSALHFLVPPGYWGEPISLRKVMRLKRQQRPTLGQRLDIARLIGQALQKWHLAGWVHQGIASHNVVFFRSSSGGKIDFSRPHLCGFVYTRVVGRQSSERHTEHRVAEYDLYQHPRRQGLAEVTHQKEHDLYSFGLLLVEIGLWATVAEIFFPEDLLQQKVFRPKELQERILKRSDGLLRLSMGTAYENACMTCIRQDFGIGQDDKIQSRLAKAFEELVLNQIAHGSKIDNPGIRY